MFRIHIANKYEHFGSIGTMPGFCLHDGNGVRTPPRRRARGREPGRDTFITVMIENGHHHQRTVLSC